MLRTSVGYPGVTFINLHQIFCNLILDLDKYEDLFTYYHLVWSSDLMLTHYAWNTLLGVRCHSSPTHVGCSILIQNRARSVRYCIWHSIENWYGHHSCCVCHNKSWWVFCLEKLRILDECIFPKQMDRCIVNLYSRLFDIIDSFISVCVKEILRGKSGSVFVMFVTKLFCMQGV